MRFWLQIFKSRVYESTLLGLFCSNWVEGHSHASRVTSCGCIIYLWLGDLFVVLVDLYVLWWGGGGKRRGRWKLGSIWVKQPRCVGSGGVRWLESFGRGVMVITNQSLSPLSHGTRSVCMPSPKLRPLNNDTETIVSVLFPALTWLPWVRWGDIRTQWVPWGIQVSGREWPMPPTRYSDRVQATDHTSIFQSP